MSEYLALYRKWRPKTFDDVIGQDHITQTIKNEIKNNTVGHAFLFCGPRGTGKTSTARIFSRAINCEHPVDGNPCNKCKSCRGILDESIMDITEIDAASNSGVDSIRSLREEAGYTAAIAKYRVYIIDEVHALSAGAFNALLKLLEEPPEHVKFVLATTEAHKVIATINSRCQRFDFKRITADDIYARLDYICNSEGIKAEERALRMIASAADGSLRDALSCLDPCAARGEVRADFVADFLGRGDSGSAVSLCRAIAESNTSAAIDVLNGVSARGHSSAPFVETTIKALRDILVLRSTGKCRSDFSPEEQNEMAKISKEISVEKLLYAIKILSGALSDARYTSVPTVIYQAAVIKLCIGGNDGSYDALLARVGELERKVSEWLVAAPVRPAEPTPAAPQQAATETHTVEPALPEAEEKSAFAPQSDLVETVKAKWPEIMANVMADSGFMLYSALENCSLRDCDGKLAIAFPDSGFAGFRDMTAPQLGYLKKLIKKHCALDCSIVVKSDSDFGKSGFGAKSADPLDDVLKLPITEIEKN